LISNRGPGAAQVAGRAVADLPEPLQVGLLEARDAARGGQQPGDGEPCARQHRRCPGRPFDRQIGSAKRGDRYADCRIRTGFAVKSHIFYAPGDGKWLSGESRLTGAYL